MNINNLNYIPCLRWKMGEYQAVSQLSTDAKKECTPLIELPELGWDFKDKKNMKTINQLLEPFAKRIHDKWGTSSCFIDVMKHIKYSDRMTGGIHPESFAFKKLREMKCLAIPVISLERDEKHLREIKAVLHKDRRGICFRIPVEQATKSSLKNDLDSLIGRLKADINNCDFILDLGAPNFVPLDGFVKVIRNIVRQLPYLNEWRKFAILGTSFPETMAVVKKGGDIIQRHEWQLYKNLIGVLRQVNLRIPAFGDYAIANPNTLYMDMRIIKPAASIRYTVDNSWCIIKGGSYRDDPEQYHNLSKILVESQYFCGASFSYGDDYIQKCAKNKVSHGNLSTWRKVGTNHHIEKVIRDIANLYAS